MKRANRITRSTEFRRVRQQGKSYASPLVVLVTARNDLSHARVGIIAGQRVGGAVQRNRAKRRIRAILHNLLPSISPGWDLIIIARPPVSTAAFTELELALLNLLKRAGVYQMDLNERPLFTPGLPG